MNHNQLAFNPRTGRKNSRPAYGVYDAFVGNTQVDWDFHFNNGLILIDHLDILSWNSPNLSIREETTIVDGHERRDVYWETPLGTLHEYYQKDLNSSLLPWRMEYFIKTNQDYRLMYAALEGSTFSLQSPKHLFIDPHELNIPPDSVIPIVSLDRTPLQKVQIDFTGLEKFALDLAFEDRDLLDLIELMNHQILQKFELVRDYPVNTLKLWENLSIEVLGPQKYREYLTPLYHKINNTLAGSDKKLHVHYDGKLKLIKEDIAEIGFAGIDSFCTGPEGDLSVKEAVESWKDTFLWINPSLTWFSENPAKLLENLGRTMEEAGDSPYCFVISEDVPPYGDLNIGAILRFLK